MRELTAKLTLKDEYSSALEKAVKATLQTEQANQNLQKTVDRTAAAFERAKLREEKAQLKAENALKSANRLQEEAARAAERAAVASARADEAKVGTKAQANAAEIAERMSASATKAADAAEKAAEKHAKLEEAARKAADQLKAAEEASIKAGDSLRAAAEQGETGFKEFRNEAQLTEEQLAQMFDEKYDLDVRNEKALKAVKSTDKAMKPLKNPIMNFIAKTGPAMKVIGKVLEVVKQLASKAWEITLKVKDGVSAVLGRITDSMTALAKGIGVSVATAAVAASAAAVKAITAGAQLEDYEAGIKATLGASDAHSGKSSAEIDAVAAEYMAFLQQYASDTYFDLDETMSAGMRILTATGGNTNAAVGYIEDFVGNMAAQAQKGIDEAAFTFSEILSGQYTSAKQSFNLRIDEKSMKAAGYDPYNVMLSTGVRLVDMLAGQVAAREGTTSGKWGSITGTVEGAVAEAGRYINDSLAPALDDLKLISENVGAAIRAIGAWAAPYIGQAASALTNLLGNIDLENFTANMDSAVQSVVDWATPIVQPLLDSLGTLKEWIAQGDTNGVGTLFDTLKTKSGEALASVSDLLAKLISFGTDHSSDILGGIGGLVTDVSDTVSSVSGAGIAALDYVDRNWDSVGGSLDYLYDQTVGTMFADLQTVAGDIQTAFETMEDGPDSGFNRMIRSIADGINRIYSPVADVIKGISGEMANDPDAFFNKIATGIDIVSGAFGALVGLFASLSEHIMNITDSIEKIRRFFAFDLPEPVDGVRVNEKDLPEHLRSTTPEGQMTNNAINAWMESGGNPGDPLTWKPIEIGTGGGGSALDESLFNWMQAQAGDRNFEQTNNIYVQEVADTVDVVKMLVDELEAAGDTTK